MIALVSAQMLGKAYRIPSRKLGEGAKLLHAVSDVSLSIQRGSIFGIVGESGSGKSTLGRLLIRLEKPTSGQLYFAGEDVTAIPRQRLSSQMQMIFQNPYGSFNPKQKIQNALMEVAKVHKIPKAKAMDLAATLIEEARLPESCTQRLPSELSGGQLQRLAIVRALMLNPEFLVADEPVSSLDVSVQAQILNLLLELKHSHSLSVLFISHEMPVVKAVCDEAAVMYLGSIVEMASTSELFSHPSHPYTKALLSAVPSLDPKTKKERIILKGDMPSPLGIPQGCPFAPRCPQAFSLCKTHKPVLTEAAPNHMASCHLVSTDKEVSKT